MSDDMCVFLAPVYDPFKNRLVDGRVSQQISGTVSPLISVQRGLQNTSTPVREAGQHT